jgi:hypothetical protein
VLGEQRRGQRLHQGGEGVGGAARRVLHDEALAALGERDGLAGQRHRRQGFTDAVEQLEQHVLTRDGTTDQPGLTHRP